MPAELSKYFRAEARELLEELTRGLFDLEGEPERVERIGQCFRYAHTLKGAARVVGNARIAELAHAIEDALAPYREGDVVLDRASVRELFEIVELVRREVTELNEPSSVEERGKAEPRLPGEASERFDSVRVEITEMNALTEELSEAGIGLGGVWKALGAIDAARRLGASLLEQGRGEATPSLWASLEELTRELKLSHELLQGGLDVLAREIGQAQRRAGALRLVPVSAIFVQLELAARDTAGGLGKEVDFVANGGEVRLEAHILSAVRDALLHVVRNAVDHGIEPGGERRAKDKPSRGLVHISAARRGRAVLFSCDDDGRGLDVEAIRRAASARGLLSPERASELDVEGASELVFHAGLSTASSVTEISGRGVGLDVVRAVAERFGGSVRLSSRPGQGTTLSLEVPIALSSMPVLVTRVREQTTFVPLDAVRGAARVARGELIQRSEGYCILHEGRALRFVELASLLGRRSEHEANHGALTVVIVESASRAIALGVDGVLGTMEVAVKPLPRSAGEQPLIAGVSFDDQGAPLLVVNPREIVLASPRALRVENTAPAAPPKPPILVIDDSLTTRILEKTILESAGYEVDLASSGEEGLLRASERRYSLFIVDLEMPGMSGFDFIKRARADPALGSIPVIIVSSLSSDAYKKKSIEAGAACYIVKGQFDQRRFVQAVAELVK